MKRERPDKRDREEGDKKIPARPEGNRHVVLITDWGNRSRSNRHSAGYRNSTDELCVRAGIRSSFSSEINIGLLTVANRAGNFGFRPDRARLESGFPVANSPPYIAGRDFV